MDRNENQNFNQESGVDNSLRRELGLPDLTSDENAPEVDWALLSKFAKDEPLDPAAIESVMDRLTHFAEWRNAHSQLVVQEFHRNGGRPTPPTSEPK